MENNPAANLTVTKDDFSISTDKTQLDIDAIYTFLRNSYWAEDLPLSVLKRSIEGSLCFGVYHKDRQIGFARVISDFATFAYLADVFILDEYQGQGLSKWLMSVIMAHPKLQRLRRWMLATRDAHGLYQQFGFNRVKNPDSLMEITVPDIYKSGDWEE